MPSRFHLRQQVEGRMRRRRLQQITSAHELIALKVPSGLLLDCSKVQDYDVSSERPRVCHIRQRVQKCLIMFDTGVRLLT